MNSKGFRAKRIEILKQIQLDKLIKCLDCDKEETCVWCSACDDHCTCKGKHEWLTGWL